MKEIEEIREMMEEEGAEQINFLYHRNRPTIQRKGVTYEILCVTPNRCGEKFELEVIEIRPSYVFKLQYLEVDGTWRKASLAKIGRIVKSEIDRWNGR